MPEPGPGPGGSYAPLHIAFQCNENRTILKSLIQVGANVNALNEWDFSLLHMTAERNDAALVDLLVAAGADPNERHAPRQHTYLAVPRHRKLRPSARAEWTLLHAAATCSESPDLVWTLVQCGADVGGTTHTGATPLHKAAAHGHTLAVVDALLAAGADVNADAFDGSTPLHDADRATDFPRVTGRLARAGADMDAKTTGRSTARHLAARENPSNGAFLALLCAGADPDIQDSTGWTACDYARFRVLVRVPRKAALTDDSKACYH